MQTPQQVVDCLLNKKKADRIALMENAPWPETIAAWVQQGYPIRMVFKEKGQDRWRRSDGMWIDAEKDGEYEEPVPPWEQFGFDMVRPYAYFDVMPQPGVDELVEETDEWEVKRNGAGAALKFWKHKSGAPEHVNFQMTNRDIWQQDYRPHVVNWDDRRMTGLYDADQIYTSARKAQRWVYYGHYFIWELMRQSMGDITLYESLLLDPAWIHDYSKVYLELYKKGFVYLFNHIGLPDGIWIYEDLGYRNGLFASPKVLNELIFPYEKKLVDFFHSYHLPVVLHTCGSTAQALPLIIEAGFDGLNPIERKAKDNDPFIFAEKFSEKLAFIGGFDVRLFETNDKELIRREMTNYIQGMKMRGARLVFASDHSLSPTVRYDTYNYAVQVYHDLMMY